MQTMMVPRWRGPAVSFVNIVEPVIEAGDYEDAEAVRAAYSLCYCYLWARARAIEKLQQRQIPWGKSAFEMIVCLKLSLLWHFAGVLLHDRDPFIRAAAMAVLMDNPAEQIVPGSREHDFLSQTFVFVVTENTEARAVWTTYGEKFSESPFIQRVNLMMYIADQPRGLVN